MLFPKITLKKRQNHAKNRMFYGQIVNKNEKIC